MLYSQADAILSPEASAELQTFMADGVLPAGWVCDGARR